MNEHRHGRLRQAFGLLALAVLAACGSSTGNGEDGGPDATGDAPAADAPTGDTSSPEGGYPGDVGPDTNVLDVGKSDDAAADGVGADTSMSDGSKTGDGPSSDGSDAAPVDAGGPPDAMVTDAPTPPDSPTAVCSPGIGMGYGGPGTCGTGTEYTCGADTYDISCQCPTADCTCTKNGTTVKIVGGYTGCPGCGVYPSFSGLAAKCGIPF